MLKANLISEMQDLVVKCNNIIALQKSVSVIFSVDDELADELGDYYEQVQASNNYVIKAAYSFVRNGIGYTAKQQLLFLQAALIQLHDA